jgi:hypothetical protein
VGQWMSSADALAGPVALLGVLVHFNEAPDISNIDSKQKLFESALRVERDTWVALLCARLGQEPVTARRKDKTYDALLDAVAAVFGWHHGKANFYHDAEQSKKMEEWLRCTPYDKEAVVDLKRRLLQQIAGANNAAGARKRAKSDEEEEKDEEEERFDARDAMATLKGVAVAQERRGRRARRTWERGRRQSR